MLPQAASRGKEEAVLFLLENGAALDMQDAFGNTPLDEALRGGHSHVVHILEEYGKPDRKPMPKVSFTLDD